MLVKDKRQNSKYIILASADDKGITIGALHISIYSHGPIYFFGFHLTLHKHYNSYKNKCWSHIAPFSGYIW